MGKTKSASDLSYNSIMEKVLELQKLIGNPEVAKPIKDSKVKNPKANIAPKNSTTQSKKVSAPKIEKLKFNKSGPAWGTWEENIEALEI